MSDDQQTDAVRLTKAERQSLSDVVFPLHYGDPDLDAVVDQVERLVADRLAAARADAYPPALDGES